MGNLDPPGAERDRLVNHGSDAVYIGAMDDSVDREQNAKTHHFSGESLFARIGAFVAGNSVCRGGVTVLDRDLDVVEAGFRKRRERFLGEPNG